MVPAHIKNFNIIIFNPGYSICYTLLMDPKKVSAAVKAALRLAYRNMKDTPGKRAFLAARVSYGKYKCAKCTQLFGPTMVKRDHIDPVDPLEGWISWDDFIHRLFFGSIQVLCKECHDSKTKIENAARRKAKKNAKV